MDWLVKFGDQPLMLIGLLFALSLLPLLVIIGSSFLKIAIVLSLLRNALGIQQVPPNMAIYGMALILTVFIMTPVAYQISDNLQQAPLTLESENLFERLDQEALSPYRTFLSRHTESRQVKFFSQSATQLWPDPVRKMVPEDSLFIMLPAFMVSQLIESFKIGLLLYLPFIAIDLIISNILLAMGMMMVSPMTISLPFKLLVFIMVGGWERLLMQLVLSYK
ncbi:type III secretion system export apparatus subunit SctR [Enterobacteriaceae bacterium H20N1]|uniref:Type III secretion system export apparatus subunit SctR n=1 Tax=Dryocola boscaweniae TaxID=2925397 RepID=A0A9X2W767_9ENTR|nr:type III secretion system export apparatus subunit SctR [Dryocola boscaweniae]MCT4700529.1 type III secretion system export apparatus subunit SctR [Dryocola boscaweniae]MCT4717685.1 type III secretion system export apparatus subunit SctR [Dryocola boscaweniae]